MTDEEITALYSELVEHYGDALLNFEHYPRSFAKQVRVYLYYKFAKNSVQ